MATARDSRLHGRATHRDIAAESAGARGAGSARGESAWLIPLAGPPLRAIELTPTNSLMTIGRQENCQIRLPSDAVSRQHAQLRYENGQWRLSDLKSRWGTFINDYPMTPGVEIALHPHDLVRISPWTFNFSPQRTPRHGIRWLDDGDRCATLVQSSAEASRPGSAMAEERLVVLLDCAAATHAATEERALAEAVVDAARRGSGLPNAALLRAVDIAAGHVEVIAARHAPAVRPSFSRSLLTAASTGQVAQFTPYDIREVAASLITMQGDAALCIPLMLGPTVAAYLYLDARRGVGDGAAASLSAQEWQARLAFCLALGRIAGLALANLRRMEMERRAAAIDAELRAAAEAQHWVLPHAHVEIGGLRCEGESRAGRHVGGDFFDIVPLDHGRVALALGDVSGKGSPLPFS